MAALWLHDAQIQKHVSNSETTDSCHSVFTASLQKDGEVCNCRDACGRLGLTERVSLKG